MAVTVPPEGDEQIGVVVTPASGEAKEEHLENDDGVIIGDGYGLNGLQAIMIDSKIRLLAQNSADFRSVQEQCNHAGIDVRLLVSRIKDQEPLRGFYIQLLNFLSVCIFKLDGNRPKPFSIRDPEFNKMSAQVIGADPLPGALLVKLLHLKQETELLVAGAKV